MREFEFYEMIKIKCPVCGCKNKVHTELLDRYNVFKGYSLKCCGCGNYNQFLLNYKDNGNRDDAPVFVNGKQRCIQPSFCPRKDCKLYGTCKKNIKYVDSNRFQVPPKHLSNENILDVEVYEKPNFL